MVCCFSGGVDHGTRAALSLFRAGDMGLSISGRYPTQFFVGEVRCLEMLLGFNRFDHTAKMWQLLERLYLHSSVSASVSD